VLEAVFAEEGWETEKILDAMRSSEDLYYDSVSQIRMPTWSQGRVALVGDAAFCPSLLAGQGSSLAMAGSYALAGELKKSQGDYKRAFERYESLLKPLLMRKQDNAKDFGSWFAPDSAFKIFLRNQITELFAVPFIARRFVRGSFADDLELPYY
jgi:2-polyprenyl-6-methoxyphenol hydroxylase-like FAD-dependent oxidoreductase